MAKRAREVEQAENHERWLITYADMITLLMVFFIVLYAGSVADSAKFKDLSVSLQQAFNVDVLKASDSLAQTPNRAGSDNLVQAVRSDLEFVTREMDSLRAPGLATGGLEVEANQEGILISLHGNLLFDSGKATLKDEAIPTLARLTAVLRRLPYPIRVEGHTDNVAIQTSLYPSNWELSAARATAVVRHLVDGGISAQRLQAAGFGETRPRGDNTTREQRARNRRVDIQILYAGAAQRLTDADLQRIQAARAEGLQ